MFKEVEQQTQGMFRSVAEMPEDLVAGVTQQRSHGSGGVVVIHSEGAMRAWGCVADGTGATLVFQHPLIVPQGNPVASAQLGVAFLLTQWVSFQERPTLASPVRATFQLKCWVMDSMDSTKIAQTSSAISGRTAIWTSS